MHANAMPGKSSNQTVRTRQHREAAYQRACNAASIQCAGLRGLWKRIVRYYGQVIVEDKSGMRSVSLLAHQGQQVAVRVAKESHPQFMVRHLG